MTRTPTGAFQTHAVSLLSSSGGTFDLATYVPQVLGT